MAPVIVLSPGASIGNTRLLLAVAVCSVAAAAAWVLPWSSRLRRAEELNTKRMRELQALVDATIRLSRSSEPRQAADLVAQLAVNLLGASSSLVLLATENGPMEPAG